MTGEYKTRSRVIKSAQKAYLGFGEGRTWRDWWALDPSRYNLTQSTESYRISRASETLVSDADFLAQSAEFSDVTRNGFTEPSDPNWDTGHPFYTTKTSLRLSHPSWSSYFWDIDGSKVRVKAPLLPLVYHPNTSDNAGIFPAAPRLNTNEISSYGAKAIGHAAPTNPHSNLAQFLGEFISDGLPMLVGLGTLQNRAEVVRSAGGEYLNVQFGWKPLISDVKKFATVAARSAEMVRQFQRDSGRLVRRSYAFPTIVSGDDPTNNRVAGQTLFGMPPSIFNGRLFEPGSEVYPQVLESSVKAEDYWFKGAFMYYLEADKTVLGKLERFEQLSNNLLGTRLTPDVLWELAPWSWLVDWLGTFGDFLHASSLLSSDSLVMKYGYLMRKTVEFNQYSIPDGVTFAGGLKTGPINSVFLRETKERVKATPYGFSLSASSFSAQQWAILGALGLSRAPGILP